MSSFDFRQITQKGADTRAERLFRAAVTAFCSLTRPSRREIGQLDDLALPLFDHVSVEARRYVAAALSEYAYAPPGLVRRLCEDVIEVAAPLLMRSPILNDVDLIAIIGRHGRLHARAIARRANLHPTIGLLTAALARQGVVVPLVPRDRPAAVVSQVPEPPAPTTSGQTTPGHAAEETRRQLRGLMQPSGTRIATETGPALFARLRDTAMTGEPAFVQTALADALDVDFATAGGIVASNSCVPLLTALRALELSEEQAFVIAAAVFPGQFAHAEAIRLFLTRFRTMHRDAAVEQLRGWRAGTLAAALDARKPALTKG